MVNYRRNRIADGTYFFTITLRNRSSNALVREIDALRDAWRTAKARIPHEVIALVVLPDHLHAVIEMRDGPDDYPRLWQDIKKGFTRRVQPSGASTSPWQSRFWEHTIRDEADLQAHIDYVHINPMKHGLVERNRGLAAFVLSSLCSSRIAAGGLGWVQGIAREFRRARSLVVANVASSPGKRRAPGTFRDVTKIPECGLRPYPGYG